MPDTRGLVVDDEPIQRLILSRMLGAAGVSADCAADLREAGDLLERSSYDVVLLDLSLRDEDSLVLLRRLTTLAQSPSIIFVSGMDNRVRTASSRLARMLGLKVAGTLSKPIQADALRLLLLDLSAPRSRPEVRAHLEATADDLAAALDRGEVVLHYQPKVALATGAVIGAEALARWHSPDYGPISPEAFIALAERIGEIDRLTDHVLATGLAMCARLRQIVPGFTMAINVSPVSLRNPALPDRIDNALRHCGLPPGALIIELTEGRSVEDANLATETLTRLRIRGISLSIDDFGTGHSTLLSLLRLPFSELKIDKSFIRDLPDDAEAAKITRATVALARELGVRTVAEGIETEACAALLRRIGCEIGQGWLFSKALSSDEIVSHVAAGSLHTAPSLP